VKVVAVPPAEVVGLGRNLSVGRRREPFGSCTAGEFQEAEKVIKDGGRGEVAEDAGDEHGADSDEEGE
jgi:hypothetical protein